MSVPADVEDKCLAENNSTRLSLYDQISRAKSDGHLENIEMKYMCYVHCAAAEMNILDSNDQLDIELFQKIEHLQEENVAVIEECNRVISLVTDRCIYAFQILICYINNIRSINYINIAPGFPQK